MIVIDKLTAQYLLHEMFPEGISSLEFVQPPLAEKIFHRMFSRKLPGYEQITHDFHRGLQQIAEDGTLRRILQKHGLQ